MQNYLGGLANISQWFVWRMTWDEEENKFAKVPQPWSGETVWGDGKPARMDAQQASNWRSYNDAAAFATACNARNDGYRYTIGFMLTAQCGYWFLDLDAAVTGGTWSDLAQSMVARFPGAFMEVSSSGNGLHIIGRGVVPEHSKRRDDIHAEFYTERRGIAFGSNQVGHADTDHTAAVSALVAEYFQPALTGAGHTGDGPRDDWSGPADDEALLQLALASRSVAHRFGAGSTATFAELWKGDRAALEQYYGANAHKSEPDGALSKHLAFWTGCDLDRMMRLMWQSGLVREKWYKHRKLVQITCESAINSQRDVFKQAERVDVAETVYGVAPAPLLPALPTLTADSPVAVVSELVTAEQEERIQQLLGVITSCETERDIHNTAIAAIRASGIPAVLHGRFISAIRRQLQAMSSDIPLPILRGLLAPPRVSTTPDAPEWSNRHVYVLNGDKFFSTMTGTEMTRTGFNAQYNRNMPERADGSREDAAQWCLERWNMTTVDAKMYAPDESELIFNWQGATFINQYNPMTVTPTATAYTQLGVDGIERLKLHLWHLCGQRSDVYELFLAWMAHNVQRPGIKIKFCPLIKGSQGDGKSIIGEVLACAMGSRNVAKIGPELVANSGGFTDWAHGAAVTVLEEIMITGKDRYRVANAVKQYITEREVTLNPKGGKPLRVRNANNWLAFTNLVDAVPLTADDRRWWVIFSPYRSKEQYAAAMQSSSLIDWFEPIYAAMKHAPGEFRKWLLELPISPEFIAHGYAPETAEKNRMRDSGMDEADLLARTIVEEGCYGVTRDVVSSAALTTAMSIRGMQEGDATPKTTAINRLLSRMGFSYIGHVFWDGKSHRVWVQESVPTNNTIIREILDSTKGVRIVQQAA